MLYLEVVTLVVSIMHTVSIVVFTSNYSKQQPKSVSIDFSVKPYSNAFDQIQGAFNNIGIQLSIERHGHLGRMITGFAGNNLSENQFFRLIIANKKGMVLASDKGIDEIDLMDISSLWIIPTDIKARYQDDL